MVERFGKKSSSRFHVAIIPKKAIMLGQNMNNPGSTTALVDMERGYCFVAKIQQAHIHMKIHFFMLRVDTATFVRGINGVCGIKICLYYHGSSIRLRCFL